MGRQYYGDIEGKLGFQQESDGLSRFGGQSNEPQQIEYVFSREEDLEIVEKELNEIKHLIGEDKIKSMIVAGMAGMEVPKHLNLTITHTDRKNFQDFLIGVKILTCLKEKGSCIFKVDL